MGQGSDFPQANNLLGPPLGWTEEECYSLPVHNTDDRRVISCWELSDEEVEEIVRTRKVWLHIWGRTMPPACVDGRDPWRTDDSTAPEGEAS